MLDNNFTLFIYTHHLDYFSISSINIDLISGMMLSNASKGNEYYHGCISAQICINLNVYSFESSPSSNPSEVQHSLKPLTSIQLLDCLTRWQKWQVVEPEGEF